MTRGGNSNKTEDTFLYGEQGNDRIFSVSVTTGDVLMSGGTGDDYLIGGERILGDTRIYGGADQDYISTAFYQRLPDAGFGRRNRSNEYIYGDYKYGADALDKDLHGDADVIVGGNGTGSFTQRIHGGDGDD